MDTKKIELIKNMLLIENSYDFAVFQCILLIEEYLKDNFYRILNDSNHRDYDALNRICKKKNLTKRLTMGPLVDALKDIGFFDKNSIIKDGIGNIVTCRNHVAHSLVTLTAIHFDETWQFFREFVNTFQICDLAHVEWTISYRNKLQTLFKGQVQEITCELPATEEQIKKFYAGAPLDWDIIVADADIQRDQKDEIFSVLREPSNTSRLVAITAEPGAGKSTLAWRLARDLSHEKAFVLHIINADNPDIWYQLSIFYDILKKPFYVLVDDVFRNDKVLSALRNMSRALPITILATSRKNEYRTRSIKGDITNFDLAKPSQREKERLLTLFGKTSTDLSVKQNQNLENASVFLVLMMELTTGQQLKEIIRDTLERLEKQNETLYLAYEYVCLSYSKIQSIPVSLLERLDKRFYNLGEQEDLNGLVFPVETQSGQRIRAGHPVIAKETYKLYAKQFSTVKRLQEIIQAVDVEDNFQRDFLISLLHMFVQSDKKIIQQVLTKEKATVMRCQQHSSISNLFIWKNIYRAIGDNEQATQCMEKALQTEPVVDKDCNSLFALYRELKKEREGVDVFNRLVKQYSEFPNCIQAYLTLVDSHGDDEQIVEALQETTEWLQKHPDDVFVRKCYLALMEERGKKEEVDIALNHTEQWLNKHSENSSIRVAYLSILRKHGSTELLTIALKKIWRWLIKHYEDTQLRAAYLSAIAHHGTEAQVLETLQHIQEWLIQHPYDTWVRVVYLGILPNKKHVGKCSEYINELLQNPIHWITASFDNDTVRRRYLELVKRFATKSQKKVILEKIDEWLAKNPSNVKVQEDYRALMRLNRNLTSRKLGKTLWEIHIHLNKHPDDVDELILYTEILAREQKTTKHDCHAIELCKVFLHEKNQQKNQQIKIVSLRLAYASLLLKGKQFSEAIVNLRSLLEMDSKCVEGYLKLAQALRSTAKDKNKTAHFSEAEQSLIRASSFTSDSSLSNELYNELGFLYLNQKRYSDALQAFNIATKKVEYFKSYVYKGQALIALNKFEEAKETLEYALKTTPKKSSSTIEYISKLLDKIATTHLASRGL